MNSFKLVSEFQPKGDQPQAIESLSESVLEGAKHQGQGKGTFLSYLNNFARKQ
jgi:excinuclease UvrABC helicase subunit UvrB